MNKNKIAYDGIRTSFNPKYKTYNELYKHHNSIGDVYHADKCGGPINQIGLDFSGPYILINKLRLLINKNSNLEIKSVHTATFYRESNRIKGPEILEEFMTNTITSINQITVMFDADNYEKLYKVIIDFFTKNNLYIINHSKYEW